MKTLKFIDMTLRQAGPSFGKVLSFKEKLEIARSLDRLRADTIELAPISGSKADQLANRTIASMVQTRISAAVNIADGNVEETWESVKTAKKPKLNLIAPVSPVQMEYISHKKAPAMLAAIEEQVKKARFLSEYVEFTAEDATRAETEFLYKALNTAIAAGANKITVCDTAGIMMPDEFGVFISEIFKNVPGLADIELYVENSDAMGMALASAAAAVRAGAAGVKCLAIEDGYPTMEALAQFVQMKGAAYDLATNVRERLPRRKRRHQRGEPRRPPDGLRSHRGRQRQGLRGLQARRREEAVCRHPRARRDRRELRDAGSVHL